MRITFRLMGLDLFDFEVTTDADSPSPEPDPRDLSGGTTSATPLGFNPSYGDQRWEQGGQP